MIKQDETAYWLWRDKDQGIHKAQRCGGESKWKTYAPTAWLSLLGPGLEGGGWGKRVGVRECGEQGGGSRVSQ